MKKLSTIFLALSLVLNVILGVMVFNNNINYGTMEKTEAAASQAPSNFFDRAAVYGPEGMEVIDGDAVVNCAGIWLRNMLITGDLYLTEGIGEGSAAFKNVTVQGKTYVAGGGEDSIFIEDSTMEEIVVSKADGLVRIVAQGKTTVKNIRVEGAAILEERDIEEGFEGFIELFIEENASAEVLGDFEKISLLGENASLIFSKGKTGSLIVSNEAKEAKVEIAEGVTVDNAVFDAAVELITKGMIEELFINSSGLTTLSGDIKNIICTKTASYITLAMGTFENITVQDDISSISIQIDSETVVEKLELNSRTAVTGVGLIKYAAINHSGCSFDKAPEKFDVKSGIKFMAGDEELPKVEEKKEAAPKPAPSKPAPSPTQPKPAPEPEPEPKPTDIKSFEVYPGLTMGKKLVHVEIYASNPGNYNVSVKEGSGQANLRLLDVGGRIVFQGEVDENYAQRKNMSLEEAKKWLAPLLP